MWILGAQVLHGALNGPGLPLPSGQPTVKVGHESVSYTHLTLPTILLV